IKREFPVSVIKLRDIVFLSPLILEDGDTSEVHTVVRKSKDNLEFMIVSKINNDEQWNVHVEGKILLSLNESRNYFDVDKLKLDCSSGKVKYYPYRDGEAIETG